MTWDAVPEQSLYCGRQSSAIFIDHAAGSILRGAGLELFLGSAGPKFLEAQFANTLVFAKILRHQSINSADREQRQTMTTKANPVHCLIARKHRARLTEQEVISVFKAKTLGKGASKVGRDFNVSEKAIRDIWSGRTWAKETSHLEPSRPLVLKPTGRPKGCKDKLLRHDSSLSVAKSEMRRTPGEASSNDGRESFHVPNREIESCAADQLGLRPETCIMTIDEELFKWDRKLWFNLSKSDPFKQDWKLTACTL